VKHHKHQGLATNNVEDKGLGRGETTRGQPVKLKDRMRLRREETTWKELQREKPEEEM